MKDIRVDADGEFRCWNCGNKGLLAKRTFRSKMLIGVGALLTKKKLKCGEYNDTGNAKPYDGPESRLLPFLARRLRKPLVSGRPRQELRKLQPTR